MKKSLSLILALVIVLTASVAMAAEGKVLNIWCWNDEFQSRFNDYYPEVAEIAADKSTTTLTDGTVVKWTINPNENNNYRTSSTKPCSRRRPPRPTRRSTSSSSKPTMRSSMWTLRSPSTSRLTSA